MTDRFDAPVLQPASPPEPQLAPATHYFEPAAAEEPWTSQVLPVGLIYRSYLAGTKEPRLAVQWFHEKDYGPYWDVTLGGRAGLWRYGTTDPAHPEGVQLDIEGAAFPRLDLDEERDLVAADFRGGFPLTYGRGPWQFKLAYYHLSAHLGDEFLLKNPGYTRINYSRDVVVYGTAFRPNNNWRFYGEAGWSFYEDVAEQWEFQFGAEYSPGQPSGLRGAPFMATNVHLHEEINYSGRFTFQAGWQWRGDGPGHLLRLGLHYLNGMSPQYELLGQNEEQIGAGLWFDF
ncbi:MAG: DUF1207 domain-containing protein [Pirellulales bacterium]|nr:DUF1207 domain-containing protein [Pirellulales bacterium]